MTSPSDVRFDCEVASSASLVPASEAGGLPSVAQPASAERAKRARSAKLPRTWGAMRVILSVTRADRVIGRKITFRRAKKTAQAKSLRHHKNALNVSAKPGRPRRTGPAGSKSGARSGAGTGGRLRLHRQEPLALQTLARKLAGAADRLRLLPCLSFGWFFVMAAKLYLAENTLTLHLFLQRLESLVDIVVTDENLHACSFRSRVHGIAWRLGATPRLPWRGPVAEVRRKVHLHGMN